MVVFSFTHQYKAIPVNPAPRVVRSSYEFLTDKPWTEQNPDDRVCPTTEGYQCESEDEYCYDSDM